MMCFHKGPLVLRYALVNVNTIFQSIFKGSHVHRICYVQKYKLSFHH